MMALKLKIVTILIGLTIVINTMLLLWKEEQIERINYISSWTTVETKNIKTTIPTDGVVVPEKFHQIYFNDQWGAFHEFLVKKEDQIQVGTPLFDYTVIDYHSKIDQVEEAINQLTSKKESLEEQLLKLKGLEVLDTEEEEESPNDEWLNLQKEIIQVEHQISLVENELAIKEEELRQLEAQNNIVTFSSPIEGKIVDIQYNLENPIITIASDNRLIEGVVTEDQVLDIEEGMKVEITHSSTRWEGTILSVSEYPIDTPSSNQSSQYTIKVQPEEEISLPYGVHMTLHIINREVPDALVLPKAYVLEKNKSTYVYQLLSNGTLTKQTIQTGIVQGDLVETIEGVQQSSIVAAPPKQVFPNHPFTVPLSHVKWKALNWKQAKDHWNYILLGLLEHE
jgi:HlyD family secretion protein